MVPMIFQCSRFRADEAIAFCQGRGTGGRLVEVKRHTTHPAADSPWLHFSALPKPYYLFSGSFTGAAGCIGGSNKPGALQKSNIEYDRNLDIEYSVFSNSKQKLYFRLVRERGGTEQQDKATSGFGDSVTSRYCEKIV